MKNFKEYTKDKKIIESVEYHIKNNIPLTKNVYRIHSEMFYEMFRIAKNMYKSGDLIVEDTFEQELLETDIGEFGLYEGETVPLDLPILDEEKDVEIGKPKRGGPKKFYVYVKKPDGGIKKVTWGDTTGLSVKMNDPEARKSFAARHQCSQQKDRTSAAYWACNTPRYAKQLGLSGGGNFYW